MTLTRMILPTTHTRPDIWSACHSFSLDWAYAVIGKRDWRLDLLRGFAIFVMVVDHLGGVAWLDVVTGGNRVSVSAAGTFISAAGLAVGIVSGGIALKEALRVVQTKFLQRAWTLYKLNGALMRTFSSIVLFLHLPATKDLLVGNLLTFGYNIGVQRLPMYPADIPLMPTLLALPALVGLWLLTASSRGPLWKPLQGDSGACSLDSTCGQNRIGSILREF